MGWKEWYQPAISAKPWSYPRLQWRMHKNQLHYRAGREHMHVCDDGEGDITWIVSCLRTWDYYKWTTYNTNGNKAVAFTRPMLHACHVFHLFCVLYSIQPSAKARKKPAPPRAPKPSLPKCQALYDCEATDTDELSFKEGEIIAILKQGINVCWGACTLLQMCY